MYHTTERWLLQAEHDLENAQKNSDIGLWDVCTFLSQQSAEKSLKALLVEQTQNPPPRLHSIRMLAQTPGVQQDLSSTALTLGEYYMGMRYPDAVSMVDYTSVSEADAAAALQAAREVWELVEKRLRGTK